MTILSPTFVSPSFSASSAAALPRPDGATDYRLQTILCTLDHQTGQNKTSINHWETFPAPSSSQLPPPVCRIQTNQEFSPQNQGFSVLGIWETCFGCTVHWTIVAGRVALMWHNNILKTSPGSQEKFTAVSSRKLHCRDYGHKVRLKSS